MFYLPMILLDYGEISSFLLGEHTHKLQDKCTKLVHWGTQGGDFKNNYTSKV